MNIKFDISTIANRRKFKVAKYNLFAYAHILVTFVLDIFHRHANTTMVYLFTTLVKYNTILYDCDIFYATYIQTVFCLLVCMYTCFVAVVTP